MMPSQAPTDNAALDVDTLFRHPEGLKAARLLVMKVVLGAAGPDGVESKPLAQSVSQPPLGTLNTTAPGLPNHLFILQSATASLSSKGEQKVAGDNPFCSKQAIYSKYGVSANLQAGNNISTSLHRLPSNSYMQNFTFGASTTMAPKPLEPCANIIQTSTMAKQPPNTLQSNIPTTRRPSLSSSHLGNPYLSALSNNSADPYNLAQGTANFGQYNRPNQSYQPATKPQQPHFSTLPSQSTQTPARPQLSLQTQLPPSTLLQPSNRPILERPLQPIQPVQSNMPRFERRPELLLRPIEPRPAPFSVTEDVTMSGTSTPTSLSRKRKAEDDDQGAAKRQRKDDSEKPKRIPKSKAKKADIAKYNISNDIWLRILEYCPPLFLNKARLISKNFKHMVDELESLHVNNRKENFGHDMPSAPPGLTERQYMNLLGGKGCMNPGCDDRLATRTHWPWMQRWCHACWEAKIERDDRIIKTRQSARYSRTCLERMLECIPIGMHDSFKKPHDFVVENPDNPRTNGPRLYKYHLTSDVDKIIKEYDALEPAPYQENPAHTPAEKAAALAEYQQLMAALDGKREEFFVAKKREQDANLQLVMQIEGGIKMRRDKNRKPHDVNRSARHELFLGRAAQDLPQVPEDFVKDTKAFKAATRIFRDAGSERGWLALKPKILKEWQNHQAQEGHDGITTNSAHAMSREQSFSADSQMDDESRHSVPPTSNTPSRTPNPPTNYHNSIFGGAKEYGKVQRDLSTTFSPRPLGVIGNYSLSLTPGLSRSSSLTSYTSPAQHSIHKFDEPSRFSTSSPANFATTNQHAIHRALYSSQYAPSSRLSNYFTMSHTPSLSNSSYGGTNSRMSISSLCSDTASQGFGSRSSYSQS